VDLFAPDGTIELPFAGPDLPPRLDGQQAIRDFSNHAAASPLRIEDLETVALHHTSDPEVVIVELLSRVRLAPTDRRLAVRSIQVFRIRDGKIVFFRDYFNPNGLAEALGSLLVRISSAR
jgi:uncharacterized protein